MMSAAAAADTPQQQLFRSYTAAATTKAAPALFGQLDKALKGGEGDDLVAKTRVSTTQLCVHAHKSINPPCAHVLPAHLCGHICVGSRRVCDRWRHVDP